MRPSEAFQKKREAIREIVKRSRVANPRLFGSALARTDTEDSDLDLLVDAPRGTTLFDLGGLQEDLQSLLGVRVDIRTPGDLPPKIRERVLAEALPI